MNMIGPILFFLLSQFAVPAVSESTPQTVMLGEKKISLEKRYGDQFVNNVFKDNILLNLNYLSGKVARKEDINWNEIAKPMKYKFTLPSGKTFAFHEDVLPKYKKSLVKTTNARFNFDDGFKSDGYLVGDGVCHLASLMYWAAKDAGLDTYAPVNHDFKEIPEISREYGVAIYKAPGNSATSEMQNLYITNNKNNSIVFEFDYKNNDLKLSIFEDVKNSI